jgi:hypothetical protein
VDEIEVPLLQVLDVPSVNVFSSIFDFIKNLFDAIGLPQSPQGLQFVVAALAAGLLVLLWRRKKHPPDEKPPLESIGFVVFGLILALILASWTGDVLYPLPSRVYAKFVGTVPPEFEVALLDRQGEALASGAPKMDGDDGSFYVDYQVTLGRAPRSLKIVVPEIAPLMVTVSRSEIRSRRPITIVLMRGTS